MLEPTLRLRSLSPVGSGHGWLVVADEISNLHLLNPLTGGHIELPPITTFPSVEGSLDDKGNLAYTISEEGESTFSIPAVEAREIMYDRVVLSCSPSAGSACIVLLMHMPFRKLSFARIGDERWTAIPADNSTGLQWANFHSDAVYNTADGLFYVVRADDSIQTLDLNGPSPVATKFMPVAVVKEVFGEPSRYLLQTPWGDLLQAWRFREYSDPPTYGEPGGESESHGEGPEALSFADPRVELNTTEVRLYKVDVCGQRLVKVDSLGDHALFLGYNGSMCLPIKCFLG